MSSTEDNIELLELNSPSSTKSFSRFKLKRNDNKVGSPPQSSPVREEPKNRTENAFLVKTKPPVKQQNPLGNAPETTSDSQGTSESAKEKFSGDDRTSIATTKSDTRSQREKFRERFESVKKQAGKSLSKAHVFKRKTDKIRSLKKSIHVMKRQNDEIENELNRYQMTQAHCSSTKPNIKKEAYNFFCEVYEEKEEDKTPVEDSGVNKSTEILIEENNANSLEFTKPFNLEFNIYLSENDLFWRPARKSLLVSQKLGSQEPRILENEGFYVEARPNIPAFELNILEQRLLGTDDRKWFDCQGQLHLLPISYTNTSYRPDSFNKPNQHLQIEYIPATIDAVFNEDNNLLVHHQVLHIHISVLHFLHHPLFSLENILERNLEALYDDYNETQTANKLERMDKRLRALRQVKKTFNGNDKKLHCTTDEIKKLRESFFEEGRQNRKVLRSILQTWSALKKHRQSNNYSSTTVKLNIRKEKCNYSQEKQKWDANIEETCEEIVTELELDFQRKLNEYKKELSQWKTLVQNEEQDENDLPKKPRKPVKNIDVELIAQDAYEKFNECFKPPGEPKLHFTLTYNNEITQQIDNPKEKLRRNAVITTKVYLKVLCNKIEVCRSRITPLNDKFVLPLQESFSVQLSTVPENLIVEILEQPSTLMKRKLGEIKIQTQPTNASRQDKLMEQYFKKKEIVHYKHSGVGSGVELKDVYPSAENNEEMLYTSGIITYKVGWDKNVPTNRETYVADEILNNPIIESILDEDGTINKQKLMEWANKSNPDPLDPKHSVLYEYIKNIDESTDPILDIPKTYFRVYIHLQIKFNIFRCNPDMAPFEFCDMKEIEENPRFKLLELRDKHEPEFVGMVVPNRLKEIPQDLLEDYHRRQIQDNKSLSEDFDDDEDEIDNKRYQGRKHLKHIYTKVFQQCRNTVNNLMYEDVVDEKIVHYIESLTRNFISNIFNWFQSQPTMNIMKNKLIKRPSLPAASGLHSPAKISVLIKSAMNVPLRNNTAISTSTSITSKSSNRPFVEVSYKNIKINTTTTVGSNPSWNEELIIPLEQVFRNFEVKYYLLIYRSTNTDYLSPNSLNGSITVRLFDEVEFGTRYGNAKARNWLGSIEIPVSAIAYSDNIEGLFKLHTPLNILGYDQEEETLTSSRTNTTHSVSVQPTYLSLRLKLQPHLPKLTQSMDELETIEVPYIKQHILDWNEAFNNAYSHRKFSAFALTINGKTACITRFIRPLEPPQLNVDRFDVSDEQCAHYVSTIPFADGNKFYQNVWLSTEQLLKLMTGSVIDHAVALTCYLISLDMEVWLLLGYGLPYGNTAFVLVREYAREIQTPIHFIYDVVTGTKYDIMDTLCPLQKIFCVVDEHNVWANVQRAEQVQLTRFDFSRRSDWLPLFTNKTPSPSNSIQQKLVYSVTPDAKDLEIKLDKKIRKKISSLRKHHRTVWNHELSRIFKTIIARYESHIMSGRKGSEILPDFRSFALMHWINGYIINMPYTTISEVVAAIVDTAIQSYEDTDVEFALTTQIYCYPSHVLAVWVCLAVTRQRET